MKKYDLENIMDEYSYLVRDYSAIIKRAIIKMPQLTKKWTDYSITQPDTILLSTIAYLFDYINYTIDYDYLSKIMDITESKTFLSNLYQLMGLEMVDYNSPTIECVVTNYSPTSHLVVPKWSLLRLSTKASEIFSLLDDIYLSPSESTVVRVVRGGSRSITLEKDDFDNGEYLISSEYVNRESVRLYVNEEEILPTQSSILLDNHSFALVQHRSNQTILKLSPKLYTDLREEDTVRLQYTVVDNYPVMSGAELVLDTNPGSGRYSIVAIESSINPDADVNDMKYKYYTSLDDISTLYNKKQTIDDLVQGRIDYLDIEGNVVRYSTKDNTTLDSILKSGRVNYDTGEIYIQLNRNPIDAIEYTYTTKNGPRRQVGKLSVGHNSLNTKECIVPGSLSIIFNNNSIVKDDGEGYLVDDRVESDILYNSVYNRLLLTDRTNLQLVPYNIRSLDISAVAYITTPGVDPYSLHNNVMEVLRTRFTKGKDEPGSSVQRVHLVSLIKSVDPSSIGKVEILYPNFDIVLPLDTLLQLGSVKVEYRRGGRSVWIES